MQKSIHLELPTGFRVVEKTKTMHISRAEKLLLSKRRCDYIKAVRNSNDYQLAGEQLNNCLGQWPTSSAPVVCMKHNEHWLAAIAVSGNEVVDALGYDNRELEVDPRLYGVLKKWMQRNHLTRDEEYSRWCHALQNDDDMPF